MLPSGTVTFLLTDIESSTRLWEARPAEMAAAVRRHYEILDSVVTDWGGVRPVEQGEGDSIVAAFTIPANAIRAAVDAQRRFSAELAEIHVRMAIHSGDAQFRDVSNYFGPTIIRCARLRACANGGQVLVSDATANLAAHDITDDWTLVDLGVHRLRDLSRPEHVWQVVHPDLKDEFPPLASLDATPNNLPVALTSWVGRGAEIRSVAALVRHRRLVSLVGVGGVGKTRLAQEIAAIVSDHFVGGVWWVDLSKLTDPSQIGSALTDAIGLKAGRGRITEDRVIATLANRPCLLVLDNSEHLVDSVARLTHRLLSSCPGLVVLTTSREPLGVPGELTWRVPSLDTPRPDPRITAADLWKSDATRLFVERARTANPHFVVKNADAPTIARICAELDGLPLAIELAVARVGQLSLERIASELNNRFRLLTRGPRTVAPRHQTMAASIDWSYHLLDGAEQAVFRRLGVFTGSFTIEAAEAVGVGASVEDGIVREILFRLVDKSLAVSIDGDRYYLLETISQYARVRLIESREITSARNAHVAYYLSWLEAIAADSISEIARRALDLDYHNLRAALEWSAGTSNTALRLISHLGRWWGLRARFDDAVQFTDTTLEWAVRHGSDPHLVNRAVSNAGFPRAVMGDLAFLERWNTPAIIWAKRAGNPSIEARCLSNDVIAAPTLRADHSAAASRMAELARRADDQLMITMSSMLVHLAALVRGDLDTADALYAKGLATAKQSPPMQSSLHLYQTAVELVRGNLAEAQRLVEAGLPSYRGGPVVAAAGGLSYAILVAVFARNSALAERIRVLVDEIELDLAVLPGLVTTFRQLLLLAHPNVEAGALDAFPVRHGVVDVALGSMSVSLMTGSGQARRALDRIASFQAALPPDAYLPRLQLFAQEAAALRAIGDGKGEHLYHQVLGAALDAGYLLLVIDCLEGLASCAFQDMHRIEASRMVGAAAALRDECGYRWRFPHERRSLNAIAPGLDWDALRDGRLLTPIEAIGGRRL